MSDPAVGVAVLLGLAMGGLVLTSVMCRLLKSGHPEIFRELGEPTVIPLSGRSLNRLGWFLLSLKFIRLRDPKITLLGTLFILYYVLFFVWILAPLF